MYGRLLTALLALTGAVGLLGVGPLAAPPARAAEPVEVAKLPFLEIFSPTFFWSDEMDVVRTGSINCPKGRALAGGISIQQGKASLRILESYPDGESWMIRVVNRQRPEAVQSLQVRGFALCMLPAARKASIQLSQKTKLLHVSSRFALPAGPAGTAGRQACPQGALVVSGGFGLDPESRGSASPRLELNFPDPHGWNVRAVNGEAGSAEAAQARTHAICLGTSEGADIRDFRTVFVVEKDVTVNADNGTARQPVGCGEGAYVLGGGTHTIKGRSANIETQESFPDSPSSWTIAMTNRGDKKAGNATVRLYAMCIKK